MKEQIVIIGNGIAALSAIKAIREINKDIDIYMFGREKFFPYNRIRLSKELFEGLDEDSILLQKKDWYEANGVKLYLDDSVTAIDITDKFIESQRGERIHYDKLLIASGARANVPQIKEIGKKGVYPLRTLEDGRDIKNILQKCNKVICLGGGIQGLETAWILYQHNKAVTITELQKRLMPYQLDDRASSILKGSIEAFGIKVLTDTQVDEILGDEYAKGIVTNSKESINCEVVVYSTGIKPNMEIARDSGIATVKGILVNNKMETNIEGIYAAGDVAEYGGMIPGLWNISIVQGKTAGYNMVGKDTTYENIIPVTTLNAFELSLFSMGNVDDDNATDIVVDEVNAEKSYRKIFIKKQKIVGAIVIGDTKKSPVFKNAIEKEIILKDIDFKNAKVDHIIDNIKK